VNLDPRRDASLTAKVDGAASGAITGHVLTAASMDAHNTFENPHAVTPSPFTGFERKGEGITLTLPSKSVVVLEIE
jgi:alpha-L-arabinofuranosidase